MTWTAWRQQAQDFADASISRLMRDEVFDFFAGHVDPLWTRRRILVEVTAMHAVGGDVLSLRLRSHHRLTPGPAGRHIELCAVIGGVRVCRSYTPLFIGEHELEVGIKKISHGRFSSWIHSQLRVGDLLEIGQIYGQAALSALTIEQTPALIAAGSGMTLAMAMLYDFAERRRMQPVRLLQYARSADDLVYLEELAVLQQRLPHLQVFFALTQKPDSSTPLHGHFDATHWQALDLPADSPVLVCGPAGLVDAVQEVLHDLGHRGEMHVEAYHRDLHMAPDGAAVTVRVKDRAVAMTTQQLLLESLEDAGLQPAYGCRQGICMSCTCRKLQGRVQNAIDGSISEEGEEDIRLCISRPLTDIDLSL